MKKRFFVLFLALTLGLAAPSMAAGPKSLENIDPQTRKEMQDLSAKIKADRATVKAAREKIKPIAERLKANNQKMKALREKIKALHPTATAPTSATPAATDPTDD